MSVSEITNTATLSPEQNPFLSLSTVTQSDAYIGSVTITDSLSNGPVPVQWHTGGNLSIQTSNLPNIYQYINTPAVPYTSISFTVDTNNSYSIYEFEYRLSIEGLYISKLFYFSQKERNDREVILHVMAQADKQQLSFIHIKHLSYRGTCVLDKKYPNQEFSL